MIPKHYYHYSCADLWMAFTGIIITREKEAKRLLEKYYGSKNDYYLVNAARTALVVILKLKNYTVGSEVIIPVNACSLVPEAVKRCNLKPVFADIDNNLTLDIQSLRKKTNENTVAVICIAMYGNVPDYDRLLPFCDERNIDIIQDLAHGYTARYNNQLLTDIGIGSALSMNVTKSICTFGGGVLVLPKKINYDITVVNQLLYTRESIFLDLVKFIKIIAFKFAVNKYIYKFITRRFIKKIADDTLNEMPLKTLSLGSMSLFIRKFKNIDSTENARRKNLNTIANQLKIADKDILIRRENRNPTALILSINGEKYDLSELEKRQDLPSPLPLMNKHYHLDEKFDNAEKIYQTIQLIQTFTTGGL